MNSRIIIVVFTILLVAGVIAAFVFGFGRKKDLVKPVLDEGEGVKKEEFAENPLNGVKVPIENAPKVLERRPLVVMMGNNTDARPQSNVSMADMVYEVVAEGGITRFMPVFLYNEPEKIGPVRSIRSYFLYWILELGDAMVMHDGWSSSVILEASAIDLIDKYSVRSLFRGGLYGYRDPGRLAPDNEYISAKVAREHGSKLGWDGTREFERWRFKEDSEKVYESEPLASELNIVFWAYGDYDSAWAYNADKNLYFKSTGGVEHFDPEGNVQLSAKNVIVQFAKETAVNDEKHHLLYQNVGSGKSIIFLDGRKVDSTWVKRDLRERTMFYDLSGNEIRFNRGVIWISVVPDRNEDQVTYK
ncbi:hypothetical protein A2716_04160 [candidate division WWE3 bacterium RIFCSPHIGHO2_01_FULL_40_23]|uniref:DUF3048 domain-containing protein n=1 Tax=candidate division WWE3 bacterium RIFCSPLOWO2_01_FULL_41_18 TaxID=1802625 RepID=A0A1F4VDM8_UNCKA|nr:MAG: hypothetical protein A2716_04160 [candidate division WWE3 bacterium RIFCSPHIGHO2_01_FULL_40_23]OGC55068.1 MAG: hypothetical protein A3A78_03770 [candidate division WWE3 bacterium RIFCSPLOWO2_01_FULL_41_18]